MVEDEPLNDLKPDEIYAGPAVGKEHRLLKAIDRLLKDLKKNPNDPKIRTVLEHNQALINQTGPRRNFENKNDRRRREFRAKGIK